MKKLTLLVTLMLGLVGASAFGYDYRSSNQYGYTELRNDRGDGELSRLNRTLAHVRWEVSRYRGDWRLRREVDRIAGEVDRINWRYRHGSDTWRLRREIERLRDELRSIEARVHGRGGDWDRGER
jgi:hypothetical protein